MPATFDGQNLLVTLPSSITDPVIDAEIDLYSEWKKWALLGDNNGFEPLFRLITSEDVVEGVLESGAYFFFRNDLGWRLRGADEDGTYNFTGNLIPQNTNTTMIVPRTGRTILMLGLQPVTQNADVIAQIVEGTYTVGDSLKISNAALAALVSGVTTSQEKFRDLQDLRDRITVNFDANGNRTSIVLDLAD